ncbi:hypothetical protein HY251_09375, partial [bacterium]|nr:hypothetical protein [bacterium]
MEREDAKTQGRKEVACVTKAALRVFAPLRPCVLAIVLVVLGAAPARADGVETKQSSQGLTYSVRVPDGWDRKKGGLLAVGFYGRGDSHARFLSVYTGIAYLASAVLVAPEAPN